MKYFAIGVALATTLGAPVLAQDAANGETIFNRQCSACHVVQDAAGEVLAGRNAQTGPNLYGVVNRQPGTYPDFDYGDDMVAYGETGVVWEEENFLAYVQDPTGFLREVLDNNRARGKMAFQLRGEADALDVYTYLATFATES